MFKAHAGLKRERVADAILRIDTGWTGDWSEVEVNEQARQAAMKKADAAIAAIPDPYIKKGRDRPKLPTDDCVLCAMRSEFTDLVAFIEANADRMGADCRPLALARALREQGVVA
jgi:hypothetical protein